MLSIPIFDYNGTFYLLYLSNCSQSLLSKDRLSEKLLPVIIWTNLHVSLMFYFSMATLLNKVARYFLKLLNVLFL